MMDAILKDGGPEGDRQAWLKAHPDAVKPWLAGVTTFDGGDAAAAVKAALGLYNRVRMPAGTTPGFARSVLRRDRQ